ncbi:MAG: ATP-dependent zinc metalloprotease FtsH [Oscillospiraceae bacterium]|nr:ATP-dependent zinc metalloprotease FtsH [Oscillospiraceae bacterium]
MFSSGTDGLKYSDVIAQFQKENVSSFQVDGDTITMELHNPLNGKKQVSAKLADPAAFHQQLQPLLQEQTESGVLKWYNFLPEAELSPYDFILPIILAGLVLLLVWGFLAGRANNNHPLNNFGRANATNGQTGKKVTFQDVAGMEEEKKELQEVVDFLRQPDKFTKIGAKIPHGILLSGPPGTGKTLLARAVAGEADVQFLSISGSDFMEMYVGVGASRVRDLFEQARKIAPAIIFIDEIDAVGRKRGSGMGGGHDEREQTLNQLLVEMDGFTKSEGVIVLAATNRHDILDPALLRPGRFDRQIYVGVPDASEREAILKVHAKGKCLDDSVNLNTVALATAGFTGADLSNLLNEAAILAAREDRPALNMNDLNEAMMKVLAGPEKRSRVRLQKDLRLTAIHEAGHAVAMYSLPTHDPVRQISIIPRGRALGLTWTQPEQESNHLTRNEMYEMIVGLLGGRVAEELFLKDISTGASNDIDRASKLARDMVGRYGMCPTLGTVSYTGGEELFIGRDFERTKSYSEKVAGTMDDEVKALMDKAYKHCADILTRDSEKLKQVVKFLLDNETMSGSQFAQCMQGQPIDENGQSSLFAEFETEE